MEFPTPAARLLWPGAHATHLGTDAIMALLTWLPVLKPPHRSETAFGTATQAESRRDAGRGGWLSSCSQSCWRSTEADGLICSAETHIPVGTLCLEPLTSDTIINCQLFCDFQISSPRRPATGGQSFECLWSSRGSPSGLLLVALRRRLWLVSGDVQLVPLSSTGPIPRQASEQVHLGP